MPKSTVKYTDINQVAPAHRHISGQPLSLDDINAIDQKACKHKEGFAVGYFHAKADFLKKHTFKNGLWSAK